jgi:hypothetical protein
LRNAIAVALYRRLEYFQAVIFLLIKDSFTQTDESARSFRFSDDPRSRARTLGKASGD